MRTLVTEPRGTGDGEREDWEGFRRPIGCRGVAVTHTWVWRTQCGDTQ